MFSSLFNSRYVFLIKSLFLDSPQLGQKFSDLKKKWLRMDKTKFNVINFNAKKYKDKKILKLKKEAITFLKYVSTKPVIRDDYKEIIELCLVLLGERNFLGSKFSFKAPQGMSRARWMSKIIYGAKLFLFHDQFSLTSDEVDDLEMFCVYTSLVYIKPWLSTCFPCEAAITDLTFIQNTKIFNEIAPKITSEVEKKFSRHSWYLAGNVLSNFILFFGSTSIIICFLIYFYYFLFVEYLNGSFMFTYIY